MVGWARATFLLCLLLLLGCGRGPFSRPSPPPLDPATAAEVLEEIRRPGARAVLVNIWASWCQPCREEFPDLMKLHRNYRDRGLRLVLVSGDFPDEKKAALEFLQAQGVDFRSFIKQGDDMSFIDGLDPRWSGALPATFIYDGGGSVRHFWEGRASFETLERQTLEVMGTSP